MKGLAKPLAMPRRPVLDPTDYLTCLAERNRALAMHSRCEAQLLEDLGCERPDLQQRLDERRGQARCVFSVMKEANFLRAEEILDYCQSTYEAARELHFNKSYMEMDE